MIRDKAHAMSLGLVRAIWALADDCGLWKGDAAWTPAWAYLYRDWDKMESAIHAHD